MKEDLMNVLNTYLFVFPEEEQRHSILKNYLKNHNDEEKINRYYEIYDILKEFCD